MDGEKQTIYVVKIQISYYKAVFEFSSIDEAGEFIKSAVAHNVKGEDTVTISMNIKETEKKDEEEETE